MNMFNSIQLKKPRRNKFDLSHEVKLSLDMGYLYPILNMEVVPGDKLRVKSDIFMRLAPMLAPVLHRNDVYIHYFFVPNRLLWNEWEDFITGGEDGTLAPTFPYLTVNEESRSGYTIGKLPDYLGIPTTDGLGTITVSSSFGCMPLRAYQLIWNEYYRDQNLESKVEFSLDGGLQSWASGEVAKLTPLRQRCWEKDYFTSALPWTQRGSEISLDMTQVYPTGSVTNVKDTDNDAQVGAGSLATDSSGRLLSDDGAGPELAYMTTDQDISITINDLRVAVRLQEFLEKNARAGSRYVENILAHFGVRSSDQRLQRPEYLGGGVAPVVMSEVLQMTGEQTPTTFNPLGTMGGHGIAVGNSNQFTKFFEEHGVVMGIMSVRPRTAYQQGIPKQFLKSTKEQYYWPEFAHLGEQVVDTEEIFTKYLDNGTAGTFGYQSRYAEYKYMPDRVCGQFRSSLDYWHQGRIFATKPQLNSSFVRCAPTQRIFAVDDSGVDSLFCQVYNKIDALRPMPYFGTPGL